MPARFPWIRPLLLAAGILCVGIGAVGLFVPVLPSTPLFLLAAACFARSSRRLHRWLLHNRLFGRVIRGYLERRTVPLRTKIGAIVFLWAGITASILAVPILPVRILLALVAVAVTVHLASLRSDD